MKRTILGKSILVAIAALGISTCAQADLLYTFDTSATGTAGGGGGGFDKGSFTWNSTYQAVQATPGVGGWTLPSGPGPVFDLNWPAQSTGWAMSTDGDAHISFDLSVNSSSFQGGWTLGDYYQIHVAFNGAGGWTQDPGAVGGNTVSANYDGLDHTWHFDYTFAQAGWATTGGFYQINFGGNSSSSDVLGFLVDNVDFYEVAVPEPTTLALAGLGVAGLMIFRRRK
jgi:hypothetical protein